MATTSVLRLWTDGCCLVNPGGPGGWAFVAEQGGRVLSEQSARAAKTTNNRMELAAVLEALRYAATLTADRVVVCSDSKYVVEGMNTWRFKWRVIGWKKKPTSRRQVRNVELWKELDRLAEALSVDFQWVKGHNGARFNVRADELACQAARTRPREEAA